MTLNDEIRSNLKKRLHSITGGLELLPLVKPLWESSIDCAPLKEMYRTEELKCRNVIIKAAEVLDRIVQRELAV